MAKITGALVLEQAENLRIEDPVLWAVVRGRGHIARIGVFSGQGYRMTQERVLELVKAGILVRNDKLDHVYYLNRSHDNYPALLRIKKFYEAIEKKWVKETDVELSRIELSGPVYDELKAEYKASHPGSKNGREMFDGQVTLKQAQLLMLAWEIAGESTFRPIDLSRAQGYTQAGYTKNTLMSMGNKGLVEETKVYPTTWRLTSLGVEKAKAAKIKGVESLRVESSEEVVEDL